MANIKSQMKRMKTNEANRQRNRAYKSAVKTALRKFREAADSGDKTKAVELERAAGRSLDKAASKGVIHANQAANKKSAMSKRTNAL
ncbi:30S ribosomal protein S20 [Parasphingorhabdus pacifica]